MMFNTEFMIGRYSTFEDTQTTVFFLNWFGAVNFVAYVGILYMGFKGLDRGFFVYAIPLVALQLIWIVMGNSQTGEENLTGLIVWAQTINPVRFSSPVCELPITIQIN